MDWTPVIDLLRDPNMQTVLAGAVGSGAVQVYKWLFKIPAGQDALKKRLVAVAAAVLAALVQQLTVGGMDLPRLIAAAMAAWLASTGVHAATLKASREREVEDQVRLAASEGR